MIKEELEFAPFDDVIEITPELENLLSGYTKKVKKQNAKLIPADIIKFADYYESQLLDTPYSRTTQLN